MQLILERRYFSLGTNGTLFFQGQEVCKTIELPWKDNQRRISCIPEGIYRLRKRYSPKFKWHFELMNVKHRQLILIHPANDALKELNGCIAPVTVITGVGKGLQSQRAMQRLKDTLYPYLERGFMIELMVRV